MWGEAGFYIVSGTKPKTAFVFRFCLQNKFSDLHEGRCEAQYQELGGARDRLLVFPELALYTLQAHL